ncbi:serine hydrolase [Enterococcus devriesei]|uniref:serine hydrolase domain-containing protein n=1 Tax=Enterococcus devriesei TaxID=319970 RepID=UPI001C0F8A01|nr:serine hydrolase [Enterococcus devriesei]MBU5364887.1 beta-lactamase family protein [Enterococcus devriesei]MDT2821312.1 serine hydrolase [Enterococcus devriesei]
MPKGLHRKKTAASRKLPLLFCLLLLLIGIGGLYLKYNQQKAVETTIVSQPKVAETTDKQTIEPKNVVSASIEQKLLKKNFSGTVLVFRHGKIILNKAYGWQDQTKKIYNTVSTQYCIGSVQKGQTAYLIMQAVKSGKLFLDEKLSDFYPQIPNSEIISIKDMLNMSSGLRIDEKKIAALNTLDPKEILAETVKQTTVAKNASYSYQPVNYVLLAGILEQVYQTNYQALFEKEIIKPMKLTETSFYSTKNKKQALSYSVSPLGPLYSNTTASSYADELGTGNVFMSAEDLYHYYQAFYNDRFLTTQDRAELWRTYPGEKYAGGIYTMKDNMHGRGVKARFETVADFSKDGQTGIILLSNVWTQKNGFDEFAQQLYYQVAAAS